jgi:hypothetical protein
MKSQVAGMGATVLLVLGAPATALAKDVRVVSHYHSPPATMVDRDCPPREGAVAQFAVEGETHHGQRASDTLRGIGRHWACIYQMPNGTLEYVGEETVTGSVAGCGTGSYRYRLSGTVSAPDPATGTQRSLGNWVIVPASGTDGLRSLGSGSGTINGVVTSALSEDGVLAGSARC